MADELPRLYSISELAAFYGWSQDTLWDYVRSGVLPASRVGRKYYISVDGVRQFLADRTVVVSDEESCDD